MSSTPAVVAFVIDQDGVAVRAGTQCNMPLHQCFGTTATGTARLRSTIPGTMWIGLRQRCSRPRAVKMTNVPAIRPGMTVTVCATEAQRGVSGARRSHRPDG
jgi:selenocysteine lyase/cysteine desulfurase